MLKKLVIIAILFYLFSLLQTSFFVHFNIAGFIPNFILITTLFIILFAARQKWLAEGSAFLGGFFLDVFSSQSIGWNILILLAISLFVKLIVKRHVRVPSSQI